ncbi:undecaprenyl-diphosphate phosphatase [Candidatus Daviesbacteria bacterium]|nr:undecaprenyl-diphosphate phosphatase [Candidatus Daviesbacteria bacterium]
MEIWQSLVLAVVEGMTEFLPISSTGHLILTAQVLRLPATEFIKSFEIAIQLGAILAIILLYWKTLINFLIWPKIIIAFLPSAFLGFIFYDLIKQFLLGNSLVVVVSLLIGGVLLIFFEKRYQEQSYHLEKIQDLTYKKAFLVGLFQAVSMIPGVSRAAATILGGLFLGLKRKTAVEFSFFLATPTMLAATTLDAAKSYQQFSNDQMITLGIGLIFSFITAILAVQFFVKYIQNHTFVVFGVYRIVIAVLFWLLAI